MHPPAPHPEILPLPPCPDQERMHASSTLVLIGIAALFSAAFIPHTTKPSVASTLVEVNHPVACPPQWLPVLLASSSRHDDSPVPQLDDEDHPFEGDDETLPMKRRMAAMGVVGGDLVAARVVARGARARARSGQGGAALLAPFSCAAAQPVAALALAAAALAAAPLAFAASAQPVAAVAVAAATFTVAATAQPVAA
eukprot:scaffold80_cov50-Phaeocystis_antarctica.AAC.4